MITASRLVRVFVPAIAIIALGFFVVGAQAQQRGAAPDYSSMVEQTTQLAPNLYRFEAVGPVLVGNAAALVGPDGVFLVDAQTPQMTDKYVAAIKAVSNGAPMRFLVNTHQHPDHTGGNANMAAMGVVLLARDELRARLAAGTNPPPPASLSVITYNGQGRTTIHMNGEDIQLIPVLNAHTDGDTVVHFPKADVIMVGDFYRSIQYPNFDRNNGGSVKGAIAAINQVIAMAKPTTKIVPGHGPVVDKTALTANIDLINTIQTRVAALIAQGKTQEEVIAAKPLADLDARVKEVGTTGDRFLGQVYAELKTGK